ncbi:sensor histidine kinase [Paenibacillus eucommiae]
MSLRMLKLLTILLPPFIIGGFEFIRHEYMLNYLSMEAGNFYMTIITLLLSYIFASWMFRSIQGINEKLAAGEARRAVYEDRERLARELHDDLAQTLFFLNVKLKQGHLDEAKSAVSEIDSSLRQAIFNLRTPPEEGSSFSLRISMWLQNWQKMTGIELDEQLTVADDAFSSAEEVQLFGMIQEAFTNIRKHSKATKASIELIAAAHEWELRIEDNGMGIHPGDIQQKHYGMNIMQKRAAELSASFELSPRPEGSGTVLLAQVQRRNH